MHNGSNIDFRDKEINLGNGFSQAGSTTGTVNGNSFGRKYQEIGKTSNSSTPEKVALFINNPHSDNHETPFLIPKTLDPANPEIKLGKDRMSLSLPKISGKIQIFIEVKPNILVVGKNEGIDFKEVGEVEDDELNEDFDDLNLDMELDEGIDVETEGVITNEEGVIAAEEGIIDKSQAQQKIIQENNEKAATTEYELNFLFVMGELSERHATPELKHIAASMTAGYHHQFITILQNKGMSITNENKAESITRAQFFISLNKIANTEGSLNLSEEEVKKSTNKITDYLRPEVKTRNGFSLSDIEFYLIKKDIEIAVIQYFILIGLIVDQAVKTSVKEKPEEIKERISPLLKQDAKIKKLPSLEPSLKSIVVDVSVKILKIDLEFFKSKVLLEKISEDKREQKEIEKTDRIRHEIQQVEIQRQSLNTEEVNKSRKELENQKKLSKEVILEVDGIALPIAFKHVFLEQKPGAAAA